MVNNSYLRSYAIFAFRIFVQLDALCAESDDYGHWLFRIISCAHCTTRTRSGGCREGS